MRRALLIMGVVTAASPARAKDAARDQIAALVEQQIVAADSRVEPEEAKAPYADGATIVLTGVGQWEPIAAPDQIQLMNPQGHEVKHLDVVWSRDRKTAVVSFEATVTEASYGRDP